MITDIIPRPQSRDFFLAIRHREAEQVEELIAQGADPNWKTRGGAETALAFAALFSNVDVVRVLLAHGATDEGKMPLHNAVSYNRTDGNPDTAAIARVLLEYGGDVNAPDEHGFTPLMEAAAAGDLATIELFLQHGADVMAVTEAGNTALDIARINQNLEAMVLLQKAMELNEVRA